ncbi:hypothetical protein ACERIM_19345 [Natrinema sp. H-ect1]|uniref:hypothetical protein n=1 Tax=Natrinema sp. H-ect1 TaxID=3242700 RepID=UPI00359DE320
MKPQTTNKLQTMVEQTESNQQTVRAQLDAIAQQWAEHGKFPTGTSETDVQNLSSTLFEQVESYIETCVTETTFTRREAEVWALSQFVDENGLWLTDDAIALVLATPGTKFGEPTEPDEATSMSRSITSEEVQEHYTTAKKKLETARQTIGAATYPDRDDVLTNPEIVWLNRYTIERLQDQCQPEEVTLDDVTMRLLDGVETRLSLEEFSRSYLSARDVDNVAQIAVEQRSFKRGTLHITAHTAVQEELPEIVTETDAITHHGHRYDFSFVEDPYGPQDHGRITLYASDNIIGMDEVPLEDGLAAADDHMQELLDRDEELLTRTVD